MNKAETVIAELKAAFGIVDGQAIDHIINGLSEQVLRPEMPQFGVTAYRPIFIGAFPRVILATLTRDKRCCSAIEDPSTVTGVARTLDRLRSALLSHSRSPKPHECPPGC
jgi:hypothetical protein